MGTGSCRAAAARCAPAPGRSNLKFGACCLRPGARAVGQVPASGREPVGGLRGAFDAESLRLCLGSLPGLGLPRELSLIADSETLRLQVQCQCPTPLKAQPEAEAAHAASSGTQAGIRGAVAFYQE